MEGIHTKKLVEEPEEAAIVREIFDMYEQPDTSYGDITRYYAEKGVQFLRKGTDTFHAGPAFEKSGICAG